MDFRKVDLLDTSMLQDVQKRPCKWKQETRQRRLKFEENGSLDTYFRIKSIKSVYHQKADDLRKPMVPFSLQFGWFSTIYGEKFTDVFLPLTLCEKNNEYVKQNCSENWGRDSPNKPIDVVAICVGNNSYWFIWRFSAPIFWTILFDMGMSWSANSL